MGCASSCSAARRRKATRDRFCKVLKKSPAVGDAASIAFELDPSRSHRVPDGHFQGVEGGILLVDRYAGYKAMKLVKEGTILLAFCCRLALRGIARQCVSSPKASDAANSERENRMFTFLREQGYLDTPLQRRARESNPQRLAPHLISSQAANHSRTLRLDIVSYCSLSTFAIGRSRLEIVGFGTDTRFDTRPGVNRFFSLSFPLGDDLRCPLPILPQLHAPKNPTPSSLFSPFVSFWHCIEPGSVL